MTDHPLHPCARCASTQKTCCQHAQILVTSGDVARIAAHTGREDFHHHAPPIHPDVLLHVESDPNWVRYTVAADGTRHVLKKQDGINPGAGGHRGQRGDCTFLGAAGCVLPVEVRPSVCRLYPFMYNEWRMEGPGDESRGIDEDYCPTGMFFDRDRRALPASNLPVGTPGVTMLTVLRMDPRDGERWRAKLYEELRSDREALET